MHKMLVTSFYLIIVLSACNRIKSIETTINKTSDVAIVDEYKFVPPLALPFLLAASFGEPRLNHFHTGIGIKTNQKEGYPVFAIDDGAVVRIKISPYGYGKALYVQHNNGLTSVYAHLQKYNDKIEKYINIQQYSLQLNELDMVLPDTLFYFKKGEIIAYSGNSGGSSAPHLHFEIRDTKSEFPLNPLDFYPKNIFTDTIPPQINHVFIKEYTDLKGILVNEQMIQTATSKKDTLIVKIAQPFFTFSLEGFDKYDTSSTKNGIDKIEVFQDINPLFSYNIKQLDFAKARMCNVFFDYSLYRKNRTYAYNCFQEEGNTYPIYPAKNIEKYVLHLKDSLIFKVDCYDYKNNRTEIWLNVIYEPKVFFLHEQNENSKEINYGKADSISIENFKFNWQAKSFYQNGLLVYNKVGEQYLISNFRNSTPLQSAATIQFKLSKDYKKDKLNIVLINESKDTIYLKSKIEDDFIYADTRELGTFYLDYDTIAPIISDVFVDTIHKKIISKIVDNQSGIEHYNLFINSVWVPIYYDAKEHSIEYKFDSKFQKGNNEIKIVVSDNNGNVTSVLMQ